jgi:fused signal recognition particle receptor
MQGLLQRGQRVPLTQSQQQQHQRPRAAAAAAAAPSHRGRLVRRPVAAAAAPPDQTQAAAAAPTLLSRLGRVLREKAQGDYERFVKGTEKTRERLGLVEELLAFWSLEDYEAQLEELEEALIASDFGPSTALRVVDALRDAVKAGTVRTPQELRGALKRRVVELLQGRGREGKAGAGAAGGGSASGSASASGSGGDGAAASSSSSPPPLSSELRLTGDASDPRNPVSVILIVGVNGAGKTTTVGKLAARLASEGARVTLAPGDTFRAAAKEQLDEWCQRAGAKMSPHFREGAKPGGVLAATINDARQRRDADVVLCDTAGRLHTAYALMEELAACRKAIQGACAAGAGASGAESGGAAAAAAGGGAGGGGGGAAGGGGGGKSGGGKSGQQQQQSPQQQPDETLLVLDGTTGLNMLPQAREFNDAVPLTGLILTKLDGTARGGAVVSVVDALGLPVKFVGVGEGVADLQPFDAQTFVDALFPEAAAA